MNWLTLLIFNTDDHVTRNAITPKFSKAFISPGQQLQYENFPHVFKIRSATRPYSVLTGYANTQTYHERVTVVNHFKDNYNIFLYYQKYLYYKYTCLLLLTINLIISATTQYPKSPANRNTTQTVTCKLSTSRTHQGHTSRQPRIATNSLKRWRSLTKLTFIFNETSK
jgi:hypothetical protein